MDIKNTRKNFLRGGVWSVGGTLLLSLLGLGVNALLARLLPTSDLGVYFLLISFASLCATLAQAGVLQVLLRKITLSPMIDGKKDATSIFRSTFIYVTACLVVVCALILVWFTHWVNTFVSDKLQTETIVWLVIAWVIALAYQGIITETFRGLYDIRNAVIFGSLITNSLLVLVLVVCFTSKYPLLLSDIIAQIVGFSSLTILLGLLLLSKRITSIQQCKYTNQLKLLFKESAPLLLVNLLAIVLAQGDLWIVGLYSTNEDTALYGAAVRLAILIGMPLNLLNAILPPYIVQLYSDGDNRKLEKILGASSSIASIPAAILTSIAILSGGDVLAFLYGEQFRQAAPVLTILCLGHFTHVALGSGGLVLMLTGHGKILLTITLFSSAVLILGGLMAAPYGISGIALAVTCALILQKIIMWLWIKSKLRIEIHAKINKSMFIILQSTYGKRNHGS